MILLVSQQSLLSLLLRPDGLQESKPVAFDTISLACAIDLTDHQRIFTVELDAFLEARL